jgi:hypothetical protein
MPSETSSSDGGSDLGSDGLSSSHGGFSQLWPKKTHFSNPKDDTKDNGSGSMSHGGSVKKGFWFGELVVPWQSTVASSPASSLGGVP